MPRTLFPPRHQSRSILAGATFAIIVVVAALAAVDRGVASSHYALLLPLVTYLGMITPRPARAPVLGLAVLVTPIVHLITPDATWDHAVIAGALVVAGLGCGALASLEQARLTTIAERLRSYDRATRTLTRATFLEHVDRALAAPEAHDEPIAVLFVDLDDFRGINVQRGEEGADEVLRDVGRTFAAVLPQIAEVGRLGGDRFGVLLAGTSRGEAEAAAHRVRSFLHRHADASIGVATSQLRALVTDDLVRVAEAALVSARADGSGVRVLVAGPTSGLRPVPEPPQLTRPLSYRQIRSTGRIPRVIDVVTLFSWTVTVSLVVVGSCGVVVIGAAWADGAQGVVHDVVRWGGLAWLVGIAAFIGLSRMRRFTTDALSGWFLHAGTSLLITGGLATATVADGGVAAPLAAAFFIKTLYDTATLSRPLASASFGLTLLAWIGVSVFSPAADLWLAAFGFALLIGCFALGRASRRSSEALAGEARRVSQIDTATGVLNRSGFREEAGTAFLQAVTRTGAPFSVLWVRLADPGRWPGATAHDQERLLAETAGAVIERVPDSFAVARTGARELMIALPRSGHGEAARALAHVTAGLGPLPAVASGAAACPDDGATLDALMRAAAGLPPAHPGTLPAVARIA